MEPHFFPCTHLLGSALFVDNAILSTLTCWDRSFEIQQIRQIRVCFKALSLVPLNNLSTFTPEHFMVSVIAA